MIEFDEYKVKLNNIRPRLDALADSLGIEAAKEEIDRLHAQIDSYWWRAHNYYDLWWRGTWEKEGGGCQ